MLSEALEGMSRECVWIMKSRADRRPRRELQERPHWESEEEGPAERGRVPGEGAEEPRLCGTLKARPRSRTWSQSK